MWYGALLNQCARLRDVNQMLKTIITLIEGTHWKLQWKFIQTKHTGSEMDRASEREGERKRERLCALIVLIFSPFISFNVAFQLMCIHFDNQLHSHSNTNHHHPNDINITYVNSRLKSQLMLAVCTRCSCVVVVYAAHCVCARA